jgi:uncharacterized membrane protein YqjE
LFESLRRLLEHVLALAQVRLELATTELSLEVHRAARVMLWTFIALLAAALGLLMLSMTVVIAVWDEHRLLAAGLVTAIFLVGTIGAAWMARRSAHARPRMLAATLEELRRDRDALVADSTPG